MTTTAPPTLEATTTTPWPVLRTSVETVDSNPRHVDLAQKLRFEVFNLELGEGLADSKKTKRDKDPFDKICDHILIWDGDLLVGTYRGQPGSRAAQHLGYYGAREFDFGPFEGIRGQMIELGRACVRINYRNLNVLQALWNGIADYAKSHGARYLIGCSSLTSQSPAEGAATYKELARKHLVTPEFLTRPLPEYGFSLDQPSAEVDLPKLLRAYLSLGSKICGPPALDREFKTIDFLTMLDLEKIPPATRRRYFGK